MADGMDPVEQQFIADVTPYVEEVKRAAGEAQEFAAANEEAKASVDEMRNSTAEAAASAGIYRDEMGRLRDAQGRFVAESALTAEELGHLRDTAAETSHEVKKLGDAASDTAARLDLMGLSGASTFTMLGPLLGVIGGLVILAAGVAPAFASAGLGIAAFGALAIPTLTNISQAYQQISADQQAVQHAATAKAQHTAMLQLQHDMAGLSPQVRGVVQQIMAFKNTWQQVAQQSGITTAVYADITKVFSILRELLPEIVPLAKAGAQAIANMLSSIQAGLKSAGFKDFLQRMTEMVVPAMQAISRFAGALTGLLGNALTTLMGDSVPLINFLTILVQALSGPLVTALHFIIDLFVNLATAIEPLMPTLSRLATILVTDIGTAFEGLMPVITQVIQILGGTFLQILQELLPLIANLLTPNSAFMIALGMLPGLLRAVMPLLTTFAAIMGDPKIARIAGYVITAVVAFKGLLGIVSLVRTAFTLLFTLFTTNPVAVIIIAIAALVIAFIYLWDHSAKFRQFWINLWHEIQQAVEPVTRFIREEIGKLVTWWNAHWTEISRVARIAWVIIKAIVKIAIDDIVTQIRIGMTILEVTWRLVWGLIRDTVRLVWDLIAGIIRTAVDLITGIISVFLDLITGHWNKAWHDLWGTVGKVIGDIGSLIGNFTRDAAMLLYHAGVNLIEGLIKGVTSMLGGLWHMFGSIGHGISSVFSGVLHILSPSRVFYEHGRNTLLGYIQGLMAVAPQVMAYMAQLGGHLAAGGVGAAVAGGTAAAAGAPVHVTVPVTVPGALSGTLSPLAYQQLQTMVQEAVTRWALANPGTGFVIPGRA